MIAFGEKVVGVGLMEEMVNAFLTCEYEGGERHDRRIAKIKAIEDIDSSIPMQLAGCMMMAVPLLMLFMACHKKLLGNVSLGGLK